NLYDLDLARSVNETLDRLEKTLNPKTSVKETEGYLKYNIGEFLRKQESLKQSQKIPLED
ncbi:MAG: hypothetical protein ACFFD4_21325, partial [Candidatus Odinarchaeota archaeon]